MKHTLLRVGCLLLMGLSLQGCGLFKSDLDKLLETKECQECDLSGANLEGARLEGANLTGANLKGANLRGVRLLLSMDADASLSPSRFAPFSDLTKVNLTGANLTEARLDGANLTGASLKEANLTDAVLMGVNLDGADTTGGRFCRTIMPDGSENNSGC